MFKKKINPIHNIYKLMFVHYKCHILIEFTFLTELMLIKQVHQKSVIFVTIDIFYAQVLCFIEMSAANVMIY